MSARVPSHCIIPPYLIKKLLEKVAEPEKRQELLNTLTLSARIRGRREILAQMPVGASVGTKRRAIHDAKNGSGLPGDRVRREGDPESEDAAVNEAYEGLGATYDLFSEEYGRNSIDDRGMLLLATVHFGQSFNNAFWDGTQMVFGDGDGELFTSFTKSIDVIGHELTHGVVDHTSKLVYEFQSGALNESFADVFGVLVKQRVLKQKAEDADWLIGAEIFTPVLDGDALRSMKDPGKAFDGDPQPGHMRDFVELPIEDDQGGVHINSGIPNHAFYYLATDLGGNAWKDAGQIWYLGLRRLTRNSDFQEAVNVTFSAAGELFGTGSRQQKAVRDAWEQVGLKVGKTRLGAFAKVLRAVTPEAEATAFNGQVNRLADVVTELSKKVEDLGKKVTKAGK